VATDDLHAPLGLERPAAGRPILYSVAAAALGIAAAAVVIGAAAWYEPRTASQPAPLQATIPAGATAAVKPEPPVVGGATPRVVQIPGTAVLPRPLPQITGAIAPAGPIAPAGAPDSTKDQPGADRIITIIDGRSGARQEVRIPATSDTANAPPPDPGFADLMRSIPDADDAPEPEPQHQSQPSRPKPSAPQKRAAKPAPSLSTNSAPQAPLR
jgi:hypothetical protein